MEKRFENKINKYRNEINISLLFLDLLTCELSKEFTKNPIEGYAAEYFAVLATGERKVYGLTFKKEELDGASKFITRYL